MKKLLILSGKGGTGKTTVAGSFLKLLPDAAAADCDVDAPNLHLVLQRTDEPDDRNFHGLPAARVDAKRCTRCGRCTEVCRFGAIRGGIVDTAACEGCAVCEWVCPIKAISMASRVIGQTRLHAGNAGRAPFSTAQLRMGSGNSGLLVTEVKRRMIKTMPAEAETVAVIDGSPGIGCPVIASMSGVDLVLMVAEPSVSGISDLKRILKTARIFGVRAAVCVNRVDMNAELAEEIHRFCREEGLADLGGIPWDPEAVRLVNDGMTPVEADCPSGRAIRLVFERTMTLLLGHDSEHQAERQADA